MFLKSCCWTLSHSAWLIHFNLFLSFFSFPHHKIFILHCSSPKRFIKPVLSLSLLSLFLPTCILPPCYHFFPSLLLTPFLLKSLLPSLLYLPTLLLRTSPLSFSSHLFPFSASSWRDIIIILVQSPLRLLLSSYDHGGITIPGQSPHIACRCPPPPLLLSWR